MAEELRTIEPINITTEMRESYIDYAMSVIIGRALPDVRDGMKPVHRRILYAMNELGLTPERQFRKSVRIVGDVLGKFHPHGDASVYDAMVRMAQDFSMRYPTVKGHGNFGSIDGDSAAAMRYTEAKLDRISMEMLRDINKDTVEFIDNFDGSESEPTVLPSRFPHILVNGSSGIAVGMATNIPPHNLGEVVDACIAYIDNPDITVKELMKYLKGPDFPTGGIIMGKQGILDTYETGRGHIIVRSRVEIIKGKNGREQIVISEIPFGVNKAKLILKIANLVNNKKIEGISEIRDETDLKKGINIVIDVKRDANASVILNQLYKHTQLEDTFGAIMLALVTDKTGKSYPKVLSLPQILKEYLNFQKQVITRRTQFDLGKAERRAHILEGLIIALDNIDRVIEIIRASQDGKQAKGRLIDEFELSEEQAQAILDMRLQRLTGLEREKLDNEYNELQKQIAFLKEILNNEQKLLSIIKEELIEIKEKYGDERRTSFDSAPENLQIGDFIDEEDVVITLTHVGYAKRIPIATYRNQKRGGRGIVGVNPREEDFIEHLFTMSTHHYLLFFTNKGKVYRLKGYEIPEAGRNSSGKAIVNLLPLEKDEVITALLPVKDFDDRDLLMVTKNGLVKKTALKEFDSSRKNGLIAINLNEGDELISAHLVDNNEDIIIGTHNGYAIRFEPNLIRRMGRGAIGVRGISLREDDYVVGMDVVNDNDYILGVSEKGFGKLTEAKQYRPQKRGGRGVSTYKITEKTGKLSGLITCNLDDEIMLINNSGIVVRLSSNEISQTGRNTQGVRLMKLAEDENIATISKVYLYASSEEEKELFEGQEALEVLEEVETTIENE